MADNRAAISAPKKTDAELIAIAEAHLNKGAEHQARIDAEAARAAQLEVPVFAPAHTHAPAASTAPVPTPAQLRTQQRKLKRAAAVKAGLRTAARWAFFAAAIVIAWIAGIVGWYLWTKNTDIGSFWTGVTAIVAVAWPAALFPASEKFVPQVERCPDCGSTSNPGYRVCSSCGYRKWKLPKRP